MSGVNYLGRSASIILTGDGWCYGFVRGMQIQPKAWRDKALEELLMPIVILSDTVENPKFQALLEDPEAVQMMADTIPDAVARIHGYMRQEQEASRTVRRGPKIGRNDPCPCGSGKKYKKCCGATTLH